MNTMRSATSMAKPSSWVTTSIVMPSSASARITSSTSPTSSGSSADVASSKSINFGSMRQRPGDGDALLLAARQPGRVLVGLVGEPDLVQLGQCPRPRLRLRPMPHVWRRPSVTFLLAGQMREQVEVLEDHADLGAQPGEPALLAAAEQRHPVVLGRGRMLRPSNTTAPLVGGAMKLTHRSSVLLPEPLGPMMHDDLAALDVEIDAVQHLHGSERLGDAPEAEQRFGAHEGDGRL